ncbi:MAG: FAD-dependent oxidoreductase [Syntrophomonadaceae bacterium]|jgi:NADPH-dependent 2,4-dienoyl-CoA reductase/sulfur reductase-like enzyme/rhodanese-related sulfurtransferase
MGTKVVIVGGVAAGASTAARLRRMDENAQIIMFEKGEHISFANCGLPYYVGGVIQQRKKLLVQTPKSMYSRFNIDIRVMSEVVKINTQEKTVEVKELLTGKIYTETYDKLVLCPGASPKIPDIPGVNKANVFLVRNIPDSDMIKGYIEEQKPQNAVIIGAGYIGMEMAEMLLHSGLKISVIEAAPQILGPLDPDMAKIAEKYIKEQEINLFTNQIVTSLEGEDQVQQVVLSDGTRIPADLVVLGIGVKPETKLAADAGIALGETGAIQVDEYLRTSAPDVYAAGDAIQVKDFVTGDNIHLPLAGPANRQGWLIANNICGKQLKYHGAQGTSIVKILDMVAANTGKNEKTLKAAGIDYRVCHTHPASHATYYPGSTEMTIKMLFTPDEGKILGAQIVGYDGVDKRIDVIATAIRAGMNVFDLQEIELAYAPPFSSAKDPVNMTAYVAGNIVNGMVEAICWEEVPERIGVGSFLLDVRTVPEYKAGAAYDAYNIPLDEIRDRMEEIPKDKEIMLYCRAGLRSYIGCRILLQHGYKVKNISGGYLTYEALV